MRILALAFLFACSTFPLSAQTTRGKAIAVSITNPLSRPRENALVFIPDSKLPGSLNPDERWTVFKGSTEISSQFVEDPARRGLVFLVDKIENAQTLAFTIQKRKGEPPAFPKRTQAELSPRQGGEWKNREYAGGVFKNVDYLKVPPQHKDHSWFIRYEGPGWESDKVGYRFYLDQRNATDVFGKLASDMVLQKVGHDNFDSYHEMQPWGMDIMKVGKSLGIGSVGRMHNGTVTRVEKTDSVDCRISQNGNLYSSITTNYFGWTVANQKTDLRSVLSIHAGSRLSHQQLRGTAGIDGICTGIVRDTTAAVFHDAGTKDRFGYLATFGKQSLNNDELGLVVFFDASVFDGVTSDTYSHVVKLKPNGKDIDYYFAAAWVREPGGVGSRTQFEQYVRETAEELARPLIVTVKTARP